MERSGQEKTEGLVEDSRPEEAEGLVEREARENEGGAKETEGLVGGRGRGPERKEYNKNFPDWTIGNRG